MNRKKQEISSLKDLDIYSLILFALFKLRDIPDYLVLSELIYVLDKDNMLKLCEYFGGQDIHIPTIEELESIVYSLLLYQYIDIENYQIDEALQLLNRPAKELEKIQLDYQQIRKVMQNYSFGKN